MQCFTIFRALCEVTKVTKLPVKPLCVKDLLLLCQMFYLPADHGQFGLELLNEFYWLKRNGTAMLPLGKYKVYYLFNILTNKPNNIFFLINYKICKYMKCFIWEINVSPNLP